MSNYPNPGQYPPPPGGLGGGAGYPQPGPMPAKSGMSTGALIAIIVGILALLLVGVIGTFAVLGIYGTRKYIANAKTAEARNGVGMIAKDAAAAYESEQMDDVLTQGSAARAAGHQLCPSAKSPVPRSIADVSALKYQSATTDWSSDPGWRCLKFEMSFPQYYQYNYTSTSSSFAGFAKGDLNGNGRASTFEIDGVVQDGSVRVAPSIKETDPEE